MRYPAERLLSLAFPGELAALDFKLYRGPTPWSFAQQLDPGGGLRAGRDPEMTSGTSVGARLSVNTCALASRSGARD